MAGWDELMTAPSSEGVVRKLYYFTLIACIGFALASFIFIL